MTCAVAALASLLVGCGASTATPSPTVALAVSPALASLPVSPTQSPTTVPSAAQPPSSPGDQKAADLIAEANLADSGSLDAIEGQLLYTAAGGDAARAALEQGVTGDQLWAALWVYGTTGSDPAPVARYVADPDPAISAMASIDDVEMGDAAGFAQLTTLLADSHALPGSEPPVAIGDFVANALATEVVAPGAPGADGDTAAWATWLSGNSASLRYDDQSATWSVP